MTSETTGASGALKLWHEELRQGFRGQDPRHPATWRYDALWRAACREAAGLEALRSGLRSVAEKYFREADEVLVHAAERTRHGRAP